MTVAEWAAKLNGREYTQETTSTERALAQSDGVVIIHGASDDLVEICGAWDDEIGAYDGTVFFVDRDGIVGNPDSDECLPEMKSIEAVWCDPSTDPLISWTYKTEIPHSTFDIMEDGEVYCRGIVFALSSLTEEAAP